MPSPAKTRIGTDAAASRDDTLGAWRRSVARDALTRKQPRRLTRGEGRSSGGAAGFVNSPESPRLQAG